ncbi:MAG: formate dehydrogenase subunit gamma [Gammaproteobacteria bacterium]|nr:formate dehydrogenase subunit gamma [Gammaproteobacteria bacterium]
MTIPSPNRAHPLPAEPPSNLGPQERAAVEDACARLKALPGALLPILHAIQDALGFVPADAVPMIARELNLTRAEVHGVITFYHYFRSTRPGRRVFRLCRAEACQSVGATALEAHAKRSLGIDYHRTTADGAITLEPVYCLGNCALGPSVLIDDRLVGRVDAARFDELVAEARRKR